MLKIVKRFIILSLFLFVFFAGGRSFEQYLNQSLESEIIRHFVAKLSAILTLDRSPTSKDLLLNAADIDYKFSYFYKSGHLYVSAKDLSESLNGNLVVISNDSANKRIKENLKNEDDVFADYDEYIVMRPFQSIFGIPDAHAKDVEYCANSNFITRCVTVVDGKISPIEMPKYKYGDQITVKIIDDRTSKVLFHAQKILEKPEKAELAMKVF